MCLIRYIIETQSGWSIIYPEDKPCNKQQAAQTADPWECLQKYFRTMYDDCINAK